MSQYIFRITLVDGRIVELPLDQPLTLTAELGAAYTVLDAETHQPTKGVQLKQVDESLRVEMEGILLAQVDGFYVNNQLAFFDLGLQTPTGEALLMANSDTALENSDVAWEHNSDNTEAANDDNISTWALLGVGALAAVGLAASQASDTAPVAPPAAPPVGPDTTVVVFDLVNGVSSDHSARTFDPTVTYTIYIHMFDTVTTLNTIPQGANPNGNTWGQWSGAANLGTDDTIILAGQGGPFFVNTSNPSGGISVVTAVTRSIRYKGGVPGTSVSPFATVVAIDINGVASRISAFGPE